MTFYFAMDLSSAEAVQQKLFDDSMGLLLLAKDSLSKYGLYEVSHGVNIFLDEGGELVEKKFSDELKNARENFPAVLVVCREEMLVDSIKNLNDFLEKYQLEYNDCLELKKYCKRGVARLDLDADVVSGDEVWVYDEDDDSPIVSWVDDCLYFNRTFRQNIKYIEPR